MMLPMKFPRKLARFGRRPHTLTGIISDAPAVIAETVTESGLLKTVGWVSAGLGAIALGLVVGRELRQRYKFNRKTPYDLYAHSGDKLPDVEFGVGI